MRDLSSEKIISIYFQQKGMEPTKAAIDKLDKTIQNLDKTAKASVSGVKRYRDELGNLVTIKGKIDPTTKAFTETSRKVKILGEETAQATSKSNDFINALRRAAIVAPVWMALRGAMQGVISTITEGFDSMVKFDTELLRIKATLSGTFDSRNMQLGKFQKDIEEMSKNTGVSLDRVANMMYKFTTLGLSREVAQAGTSVAISGTRALGGKEYEELASVLATAYKISPESFDSTIPVIEQFNNLMASTFELFKTNAFEIDGMAESLKGFLSTAGVTNISVQDSIALLGTLSTAAMKSSTGYRALSTFITKFGQEHKKVGAMLGMKDIDITKEGYVGGMDRFVETLRKADEYVQIDVFEQLGGTRNTAALKAFISSYDTMRENMKIMNPIIEEQNKQLKNFTEQTNDANKGLGALLEKQETLKKKVGQSFLQGMFGTTNDIKQTAIEYNKLLETVSKIMGALGKTATILPTAGEGIGEWLASPVVYNLTNPTLGNTAVLGKGVTEEKLQKARNMMAIEQLKKERELEKQKEPKPKGKTPGEIRADQENIRKEHELYDKKNGILSETEKRLQEINEIETKHALSMIKLFGANDVQIAALDYMYSINLKDSEVLAKKLKLEEALTEQKLKQNYYSSDSMKIFEIAKKYGIEAATTVSQFLGGSISETDFFQRTISPSKKKAQLAFKEQFADRNRQLEAKQFFEGGLTGTIFDKPFGSAIGRGGAGKDIPISEKMNINVNPNIKVYLDGKEVGGIIKTEIEKEGSPINKAVRNIVDKQ